MRPPQDGDPQTMRSDASRLAPCTLLVLLLTLAAARAAEPEPLTLVVHDGGGAAARVGAPVAMPVELPPKLLAGAKAGRVTLHEMDIVAGKIRPLAAQFEPETPDAAKGLLRWLMPSGAKERRRFAVDSAGLPEPAMSARLDEKTQRVELAERGRPVLRYNFGTVPVPKGVGGRYAVARSDYIHPIWGPAGEVLTKDYSPDHPHHRGLYWAWPEVSYKGQTLDLHALQGVFARPVRLRRVEGGPVAAVVEAESRWMWRDKEPIVREVALIRVFAAESPGRFVDLEFRFTALVDGVTVARRGQRAYGGFNLRFSARKGQKLVQFTDPPGAAPRRSWGEILGVPPGGARPIGVAILQHAANPRYPGDWVSYPNLNWLQPTFPAKGEKHPLSKERPLVLRYRLWIRPEAPAETGLADAWTAYNHPPRAAAPR